MSLNPITIKELYEQNFPPQKWLIENLIPESSVVLLSGPPASDKTWFAAEIAKNVSSGHNHFDYSETQKSGVLLLDAESGFVQIRDRLRALGVDENSLLYYVSEDKNRLSDTYYEDILQVCKEKNIKLVIFDSLVRFNPGDENSSTDISRCFQYFIRLKNEGITSLIIHHARKEGSNPCSRASDSIRGSSDILAACDMAYIIKKQGVGNSVIIEQVKNRYDKERHPFTATLTKIDNHTSRWEIGEEIKTEEELDEERMAKILEYVRNFPDNTQQSIVENNSDYSKTKVRKYLECLEDRGEITKTRGERNSYVYNAKFQ